MYNEQKVAMKKFPWDGSIKREIEREEEVYANAFAWFYAIRCSSCMRRKWPSYKWKGGPLPEYCLALRWAFYRRAFFPSFFFFSPFSIALLLSRPFYVCNTLEWLYERDAVNKYSSSSKNAHFGLLCTSFSEVICRPNWKLRRRRRNNFNISRWILIGKVGCSSFLRSYLYVKYEEFA